MDLLASFGTQQMAQLRTLEHWHGLARIIWHTPSFISFSLSLWIYFWLARDQQQANQPNDLADG